MNLESDKDQFVRESWESLSTEQVFELLKTGESGISSDEARERLAHFGKNKLPEEKKDGFLKKFFSQFNNALIYVLLGAAILTAVLGHLIDTWVILGVVIINSLIGYIQEDKAQKALDSIKHLLSLKTSVIRNGTRKEIPAEDLTIGDIVLLSSGDKIPADIRLFETSNFSVEEASLTGESEAVSKTTNPVDQGAVLAERFSMGYTGTSVKQGRAKAIVVAVGSATELGKINRMLSETKSITTPLIRNINRFGRSLSVFIVIFAILVLLYGLFIRSMSIPDISLAVIGLAVAAIPEGLPAILTITLAIGVQKMAKRNAIIRRLPSVETLGAVTVICSDKTGTLTKNEMTVTTAYTKEGVFRVQGAGYEPKGDFLLNDTVIRPFDYPILGRLLQSAYLCNDAGLNFSDNQWQVEGAPTEGALLAMAKKTGVENLDTRRIFALPFDSEYKYMATLSQISDQYYIFVNGAPERLLAISNAQLNRDGTQEAMDRDFWEKQIELGASMGLRMLGSAFFEVDSSYKEFHHEDLNGRMVFIGLSGLIDPPRPEAIDAIRLAKRSGIQVKMITGDHAITASTIGKQMGIKNSETVISGAELEVMSDEEMRKSVKSCNIFARTSPEDKLRLVNALQANGEVCAMTGDGVNDAPALKKADIGIAMGIKGTEVTKDSASMVLADDNFASIISAVEEGRTIYDNLRKTLLFILPTNGAETFVVMVAILMGTTLPISPVQILWVNMVTAVTLGISLAFEPMEKDAMTRPPRDPKESILGSYFAFRILFVSILIGSFTMWLFSLLNSNPNYTEEAARTIAVNTLVAGEFFYLFNCRNIREPALGKGFFSNKVALFASGILILIQLAFTYLPFMNMLFSSEPLRPSYWLYSVGVGFFVFLVIEAEKAFLGVIRSRKSKRYDDDFHTTEQ